jgi:hypothetical protein
MKRYRLCVQADPQTDKFMQVTFDLALDGHWVRYEDIPNEIADLRHRLKFAEDTLRLDGWIEARDSQGNLGWKHGPGLTNKVMKDLEDALREARALLSQEGWTFVLGQLGSDHYVHDHKGISEQEADKQQRAIIAERDQQITNLQAHIPALESRCAELQAETITNPVAKNEVLRLIDTRPTERELWDCMQIDAFANRHPRNIIAALTRCGLVKPETP